VSYRKIISSHLYIRFKGTGRTLFKHRNTSSPLSDLVINHLEV